MEIHSGDNQKATQFSSSIDWDNKDVEFVFFSGGFDTTFYLLECLLLRKIRVQPLVVKVPFIDGVGIRRASEYQEEVSRNNFYDKFRKQYPLLQKKLLQELTFVNKTILDKETLELGKEAFSRNIFSREVNQLLYFYQVCKDYKLTNCAVGYQKDDNFSDEGVDFLNTKLRFKTPMSNLTKREMLDIAIEAGFDSFLAETWSCWYPLPGNKPCKKCDLCKVTIVESKLKFPPKKLL